MYCFNHFEVFIDTLILNMIIVSLKLFLFSSLFSYTIFILFYVYIVTGINIILYPWSHS